MQFNDGHADEDQLELLWNGHSYKLKMANKTKKEGHADDGQLAQLIEKYRSGKTNSRKIAA